MDYCLGLLILMVSVSKLSSTPLETSSNGNTDSKTNICQTQECIRTSTKILEYMDQTVDPCDDFYEFACGKFLKITEVPEDKFTVDQANMVTDSLNAQLRKVLEEPITENEPKPFKVVKKLYNSCMNLTNIEEEGLGAVVSLLKPLGGWPVVEGNNWKEEEFDWKKAVYELKHIGFGVNFFINVNVEYDFNNSSRRILQLDQASFRLLREFLVEGLQNDRVKAYYDYMVDIAVMFGADKETAKKELGESLDFEIKLANISLPQEKRHNLTKLYNLMTVKQLIEKYPSIPWLEFLNNILAPDHSLSEQDVVNVMVPQYITDFENLISLTPKRVQANYANWRAMYNIIFYTTKTLKEREQKYFKIIFGQSKLQPRWKECIKEVTRSLPIASSALYVRKYFSRDIKQKVQEMVNYIFNEFVEILKTVDWMDEKTRLAALEKANAMEKHVGHPDELDDDNKLEDYYNNLHLSDDSYIHSIMTIASFESNFMFKLLREPVNKTDWRTHGNIVRVNAHYSLNENSINILAGILQGAFYNADRPQYINFASIGFTIGHELTHGFDGHGLQFDKNGRLVGPTSTIFNNKVFLEKLQCIIDQYGNITVPHLNLNLNGLNTQGENVADNGGLKTAYLAYQKWVQNNTEEPTLPKLEYTPNQMFWIANAHYWCEKHKDEALKFIILTEVHVPSKFRVNVPMANNENFSRDFHCTKGSKMNPEKKCVVW